MIQDFAPLLPLALRERAAGRAFVLAIVIGTAGSTYRKVGASMVIASDGEFAGLLSGGCLEGDLAAHAQRVIDTGAAQLVRYDMRGPDDLLFGLGSGCEGAMDILLTRVGPHEGWEPFDSLVRPHQVSRLRAIIAARAGAGHALGSLRLDPGSILAAHEVEVLIAPPRQVLVLGGGPDVAPLVDFASTLSWQVTVADHRSAYIDHPRLGRATQRICVPAASLAKALAATLSIDAYDAAIVMSHHLASDLDYLRQLAGTPIRYVGLLGPPHRRERLLSDLGDTAASSLRPRLHAPVGLDLGARSPETIALSIAAEVQRHFASADP